MASIEHFEDMLGDAFSKLKYLVATLNGQWDAEHSHYLWKTFEANHLERKSIDLADLDDCKKVCEFLSGIYYQLYCIETTFELPNAGIGKILINLRDRAKNLASETDHNQRAYAKQRTEEIQASSLGKDFGQDKIIEKITVLFSDVEDFYKKLKSDKVLIQEELNVAQKRAESPLLKIYKFN